MNVSPNCAKLPTSGQGQPERGSWAHFAGSSHHSFTKGPRKLVKASA